MSECQGIALFFGLLGAMAGIIAVGVLYLIHINTK